MRHFFHQILPKKDPRLVFLHIPKTAGTSFRGAVCDVYGADATYWHSRGGVAGRFEKYRDKRVSGKLFIGGHKPLRYYPPRAPFLYCSTVRDPVSRVVSLFSYFTRPESATDDMAVELRKKALATWLGRGIDPQSIVNSIEQCPRFRRHMNNYQCSYLSRHGATFEGVRRTIKEHNFVIGDSANLDLLTNRLGTLLDWPETTQVWGNITRPGGHDGILEEEGAAELIRSLCTEDQKLYDFVSLEHDGLVENIRDENNITKYFSLNRHPSGRAFSKAAWQKVTITTGKKLAVSPGKATQLALTIANDSREFLDSACGEGIVIAYKMLDADDQPLQQEGLRTPLATSIVAGSQGNQQFSVLIPAEFFDQVVSIRVGLLQVGKHWIEHFCPNHAQIVSLDKVPEAQVEETAPTEEFGG